MSNPNSETKEEKKEVLGQKPAPSGSSTNTPVAARQARQTQQKPDMPPCMRHFVIAMVIVCMAYLIGIYNPTDIRFVEPRYSRRSCDVGSWSLANLPTQEVPRYKWEPSLPFTAQLANWREPVILTNTFVTKWKALERWSNDYYLLSKSELAMMNETMAVNECQMNPANQNNPLAKAGLVTAKDNFFSLNITSAEFFSRYNDPNQEQYWYWYGKVTGSLVDDIQPNDGLWVDAQDIEQFGLYMWLSGPDIGPWWHYDQDHNFYVQVAGTKRFILIPPWESSKMHPYPQIHPRNHKAQVNFDLPDLARHHMYQNISEAFIAELQPGEVLYIPPYWWHHVRSHVRSISLASWSQSGIYRNMRYGLYKREFAFDKLLRGSPERRSAVRYLLQGISNKIFGQDSTFFRQLIQSRWDPIREELRLNSIATNNASSIHVTNSLDSEINDVGRTLKEAQKSGEDTIVDPQALCGTSTESLRDDLVVQLIDDIKASVEAFENCQTKVGTSNKGIGIERRDMQAIRDIEFSDFTEFILAGEVGAEDVLPFLDICLSEPKAASEAPTNDKEEHDQ